MYNSLPDSDPVKLYLKNNCLPLLSLPGTTGLIAHKDKFLSTDFPNYRVEGDDKKDTLVCITGNPAVIFLSA